MHSAKWGRVSPGGQGSSAILTARSCGKSVPMPEGKLGLVVWTDVACLLGEAVDEVAMM